MVTWACKTEERQLKLCNLVESELSTFTVNGVDARYTSKGMTVSALAQTPYGYYYDYATRRAFIRHERFLFMEGTAYNYTCRPTYFPNKKGESIYMPEALDLRGMPNLQNCMTTLTVPFKVTPLALEYCSVVTLVKNMETGLMGFTAIEKDCAIKLADGDGVIQNFWISKGAYRFIENISALACDYRRWSI